MKPSKVHCFFEQSGTFKTEFQKLGIAAYDYDIQNEYGQTDFQIDIFNEITRASNGDSIGDTVFNRIEQQDLIFAFFPCIYFAEVNQMFFCGTSLHFNRLDELQKLDKIIERSKKRQEYYLYLLQLCRICVERDIMLIIENPYSVNHYLYNNFPYKPSVIDRDRTEHGDVFVKPTQYFFINCEPATRYTTFQKSKIVKKVNQLSGHQGGICSKERSEITPDYARNFICDRILNEKQPHTETTLFD